MKNYIHLTDQQLVHMFTEGDTSALETLINRYKTKVFSSIFLTVKDKFLAEDLFQDLFIKVIDRLRAGKYTDEGKFLPWIMRISHNLCMDHFRKVKSTPTIKMSDDRDLFEVLEFAAPAADHQIVKRQRHQRVGEMIDSLPAEQREVIILRHYAEMSFKDIAALNNCSINTALGRMRYGLSNLRKMVTEKQLSL